MVRKSDLEDYLNRMEADFKEIADGMYVVRLGGETAPIVVNYDDAITLVRMKILEMGEAPEASRGELFRTLLELNATDIAHGAYGLDEDDLVLCDALRSATLDYEELLASMESIQMAASSHLPSIRAVAQMDGGK